MRICLFAALFLFALAPRPAAAQEFSLPLDCRDFCAVQNYVDVDPGPSAKDPDCGPLSYNGHDGLDFRVPAARAALGVAVLAPAAGVIRGARDGETDGAFIAGGMAAIANKECGNGVNIDHGDGWMSVICHMRRGSVRVHAGDHVDAGQTIGLIGLSGQTEFTHVHLTLMHNGAKVDPLTGAALGAETCGAAARTPASYWTPAARAQLAYRGARWFSSGFAGAGPSGSQSPDQIAAAPGRNAQALLYWAIAIGPRNGDVLSARLIGPNGAVIAQVSRTQPRDQAQSWVNTGAVTPAGGWPAGVYRAEARLERNGRVIDTRSETLALR
ncbi:MAG: M23 family metallopeptidase [Pseudomonadota bacterium]